MGRSEGRMVMVEEGRPTLAQLLARLGLNKYQEVRLQTAPGYHQISLQVFQQNEIDMELFLTMTDSELKGIGIELLGPRRKLTAAIARINEMEEEKGAKVVEGGIGAKVVEEERGVRVAEEENDVKIIDV